jgi:hypothetical protein
LSPTIQLEGENSSEEMKRNWVILLTQIASGVGIGKESQTPIKMISPTVLIRVRELHEISHHRMGRLWLSALIHLQ